MFNYADFVESMYPGKTDFVFPDTTDELVSVYGPANIERIAKLCDNPEDYEFFKDLENKSLEMFKLFCEETPPINPRLRVITDFKDGQEFIFAKKEVGVNGLVKVFESTIKRVFKDESSNPAIEYYDYDQNNKRQKKVLSLRSWRVMSFSDWDYITRFPDYANSYILINTIRQSQPYNKEKVKDALRLIDERREGVVKVKPSPVKIQGIFYANGLDDFANDHVFIPCSLINQDRRALICLQSPLYSGRPPLNMPYPCNRFISFQDLPDYLTNFEAFIEWMKKFCDEATEIEIAHDQSKVVDCIKQIVGADENKVFDYCREAMVTLKEVLRTLRDKQTMECQ